MAIDRELGAATITVHGPAGPPPPNGDELVAAGAASWLLAACRELDEAILDLRFNEPEIGTWVLTTRATRPPCSRRTTSSATSPATGWSGRSACTGPAPSSGSTSRPGRWWR